MDGFMYCDIPRTISEAVRLVGCGMFYYYYYYYFRVQTRYEVERVRVGWNMSAYGQGVAAY